MKAKHFISSSIAAIALLTLVGGVRTAEASRVVVTGDVGVRVWVGDDYDVYPSYDDVVVSFRAERDCYATVFVVDTDGYVHIVYPFSPGTPSYIRGGIVYRYAGCDLGLDRFAGRGVAYVFAVGSPDPFDYSCYGSAVFAGGRGYRVHGDPYIACHNFYLSLLPVGCRLDFVSANCSRFYIRQWVRYPSYLCGGHAGIHVRFGDYCRECSSVYDLYRVHVADPYVVIAPRAKFKSSSAYGGVARATERDARTWADRGDGRVDTAVKVKGTRSAVGAKARVVSTSRTVGVDRAIVRSGNAGKVVQRDAPAQKQKNASRAPAAESSKKSRASSAKGAKGKASSKAR